VPAGRVVHGPSIAHPGEWLGWSLYRRT
jgi:hypothetical protein